MSDDMFTVDLEYRDGTRRHPQFVTQQEAVSYAGRMAQDSRIARAEVRGLDARIPHEEASAFAGKVGRVVKRDYHLDDGDDLAYNLLLAGVIKLTDSIDSAAQHIEQA